jgi:hypothetical protein
MFRRRPRLAQALRRNALDAAAQCQNQHRPLDSRGKKPPALGSPDTPMGHFGAENRASPACAPELAPGGSQPRKHHNDEDVGQDAILRAGLLTGASLERDAAISDADQYGIATGYKWANGPTASSPRKGRLDPASAACSNTIWINWETARCAAAPGCCIKEEQYFLTTGGQSVMNILNASGCSVILILSSTGRKQTKNRAADKVP